MNKIKVFVDELYLTGDSCAWAFTNPMDKAICKRLLEKRRRQFIRHLESEGFEITTDRNEAKNSICLVMNPESLSCDDSSKMSIKEAYDEKMFKGAGEGINIPLSLPIDLFYIEPFFPAVFKNEFTNGGEDKLLIETEEQFLKIMKLYFSSLSNPKLHEEFQGCIMQDFIETPTKYTTYIRVYMGAAGNVMGATLKYKLPATVKKEPTGLFEEYFCNPSSPYYLNCKNMFGYYSKGSEISFSQPSYSSEKREILEAHGISVDMHEPENKLFDPTTINVPESILEVCRNMMSNCKEELGIVAGFDFILNKRDGKWYFLENQAFAAPDEWARPNGIKIPKSSSKIEDYVKYLDIDIQARYYALKAYVAKLQLDDEMKLVRK